MDNQSQENNQKNETTIDIAPQNNESVSTPFAICTNNQGVERQNITNQDRPSKRSLYSLIGSALAVIASIGIPNWVVSGSAVNWPIYATCGGLIIFGLVCLLLFVIPSLGNDKYPNISGMVALVIFDHNIYRQTG